MTAPRLLGVAALRAPSGVVRISVTPTYDLLIRRPDQSELLHPENTALWRSAALVRFDEATTSVPPAGPHWLTVRATWRVASVVIQLNGSVKALIGHHLLSIIGSF